MGFLGFGASPQDANFYRTEFSQAPMAGLRDQLAGNTPSAAAIAQMAMLQAAQRGMQQGVGAPAGVNPALLRMRAAEAGVGGQMSALSQGAQMRMAEQQAAQQALMQAQMRQRQLLMQQAEAEARHRMGVEAAGMAQRGALISGAFGLGSQALQAYAGRRPSVGAPSASSAPSASLTTSIR